MKVTVDKCPWTGKLFEDPKKFAKHLREVRAEQRHAREKVRLAAVFDEFLKPLYLLDSTDAIAEWLTQNYMVVARHYGPRWGGSGRKPYVPTAEDYVEFELTGMRFGRECSTTHSAPKGQRTTGWSKNSPHIPEPGWRGRITCRPKGNAYKRDLFDTDHLKHLGINTGTGGGGPESLSYDVTLFTKDFPGLRRIAAAHTILKDHNRPGLDSNGRVIDESKPQPLFG